MDGMTQQWISTGKAARLMGYHPASFPRKFLGVIPSMRVVGGHYRWLASAVKELCKPSEPEMPEAG